MRLNCRCGDGEYQEVFITYKDYYENDHHFCFKHAVKRILKGENITSEIDDCNWSCYDCNYDPRI